MYLKNFTLWPLFMDGIQLPQGYSHFEEAIYFLPFSSQKFLVPLSPLSFCKNQTNLKADPEFSDASPLSIKCPFQPERDFFFEKLLI